MYYTSHLMNNVPRYSIRFTRAMIQNPLMSQYDIVTYVHLIKIKINYIS